MTEFFSVAVLLFLLAVGVAGLVIGAIRRGWSTGVEAAVLAILGGFISRSFIWLLLSLGEWSHTTEVVVGWAFFLWPGAVDTVAAIFGEQLLTKPAVLLWIATGVGAFTGMMDGIWRIHRWEGPGAVSFLLDVTWGLAGTTNAVLLHLVNFAWAGHGPEEREGAHRYKKGFAIRENFAFTQGSVMSSNDHAPTIHVGGRERPDGLYAHERTHVWQNRIFGPFYTLTYLAWMAIMAIPGLIAGASRGPGAGEGVQQWCYFNCPWETWGYAVGRSHGEQPRTAWGSMIWSDGLVIAASIPFFVVVVGLFVLLATEAW